MVDSPPPDAAPTNGGRSRTLIYPVPRVRYLPLVLAEHLGRLAARRRWVMPTYVGSVFVALPLGGVALG